jgi:MoaA/NifB/PqqE/SkfB family radical SAM enzyme
MRCPHCLRGKSQNINIDTKYIDKMLSMVIGVGVILFTGGEPSLHPEITRYTVDKMKELNIPLERFSVVTNGMIANDNFISALNYINDYTIHSRKNYFSISNDIYHLGGEHVNVDLFKRNFEILKKLPYYQYGDDFNNSYDHYVMYEGMAA